MNKAQFLNSEFLGWAGVRDRLGDPTGVAHAIVQHLDKPTTENACGSNVQTYGMLTSTPREATGAGLDADDSGCSRCRAWVRGYKASKEKVARTPKLTFDQAVELINQEHSVSSSEVLAKALKRKIWVASNGIPGYMNDCTSVCTSKANAIETCLTIAGDEARGLKTNLRRHGRAYIGPGSYAYRVERAILADMF